METQGADNGVFPGKTLEMAKCLDENTCDLTSVGARRRQNQNGK